MPASILCLGAGRTATSPWLLCPSHGKRNKVEAVHVPAYRTSQTLLRFHNPLVRVGHILGSLCHCLTTVWGGTVGPEWFAILLLKRSGGAKRWQLAALAPKRGQAGEAGVEEMGDQDDRLLWEGQDIITPLKSINSSFCLAGLIMKLSPVSVPTCIHTSLDIPHWIFHVDTALAMWKDNRGWEETRGCLF